MKVEIYRSTSPVRPTVRAVFRAQDAWGDQRGGHDHEAWFKIGDADLAAPIGTLMFSADEAKADLTANGVHVFQVAASELEQREHDALNAYRMAFTLPLFRDVADNAPEILGSGTLFTHENRWFLVTADHIFREKIDDPSSVLIPMELVALPHAPTPSGNERPSQLITLGAFHIYRLGPPVGADVIVLELLDAGVIATLTANWGFLPLSSVDDLSDEDDRFVITGFRAEGVRYEKGVVSQAMQNLETDRYFGAPVVKTPIQDHDLFLYLQKDAVTVDGRPLKVGSLVGLSGGPIWSVRGHPSDGFWHPSKALRVVAVQSSEMKQKWARATDWKVIKTILASADVGFAAPPFP